MITVTTAALTFCDYYEVPSHAARLPVDSSRTNESLKFPVPPSPPAGRPVGYRGPSTGSKVVFSSRWTTWGLPIGRRLKLPGVDRRGVSGRCTRLLLVCAVREVFADRSRSISDGSKARPTSSYVIQAFGICPVKKPKADDGSTPQRIDKVVWPQDRFLVAADNPSSRKILAHPSLPDLTATARGRPSPHR